MGRMLAYWMDMLWVHVLTFIFEISLQLINVRLAILGNHALICRELELATDTKRGTHNSTCEPF